MTSTPVRAKPPSYQPSPFAVRSASVNVTSTLFFGELAAVFRTVRVRKGEPCRSGCRFVRYVVTAVGHSAHRLAWGAVASDLNSGDRIAAFVGYPALGAGVGARYPVHLHRLPCRRRMRSPAMTAGGRKDVSGGWFSWCAGLGILRNIANYSQFAKLCVIFVDDIFARIGRVPAVFGAIRRCDGTVRSVALQA